MIRRPRLLALALALGAAVAAAPLARATDPAPAAKAAVPAAAKAAAPAVKAPININTATAKELTKLDGVGDKLAKAIVDYRTKSGPFKAPEDLMKVKGIGEKKYAALKAMISVQ